nr:hypothetical protein [Tanacetum cinerariifolium]
QSTLQIPLQNSGFETRPTNLSTNATSEFVLLDRNINAISGWSYNGTVRYVISGGNVSLPGNGHGMQLGPNAVNVSGPSVSKVFFFEESLGNETWQTRAYSLGWSDFQTGSMSKDAHIYRETRDHSNSHNGSQKGAIIDSLETV